MGGLEDRYIPYRDVRDYVQAPFPRPRAFLRGNDANSSKGV